jgi:hypothetical protein
MTTASGLAGGLTASSPCAVSVLWDSAKHIGAITIKGTSAGTGPRPRRKRSA